MWCCTSLHPPVALFNHFSCVALHSTSHRPRLAQLNLTPIFLAWRCTSYHPPVALLNHFSCVELRIPSSSRGTTQSFFLCGAAHPFILPWHYSIIFLVWCCISHYPTLAQLNDSIFLVWCCMHIPSSSCGTTQRQQSSWCGTAHPIILPWHYLTIPIFLVWRCTSHPPPWHHSTPAIFMVWHCTSHPPPRYHSTPAILVV